MYYQVLRRPTHNQARFMHSLSFVVKNQFPFAEFYNCEVRISQVLLFEEVVHELPNSNLFPATNLAVATPPVQTQHATASVPKTTPPNTSPAPVNSAEDESLEYAIQALSDATATCNSSRTQRNPLTSIDDRLLRAVLVRPDHRFHIQLELTFPQDLAVLAKRSRRVA
ncbi:hypothetical protein BDV98DRAFT_398030 [Pterulicium gracile]|uniref:Uncharacterized protein n=1 Tax=Pterulicium gracile TaxID=1884261 RepID=A0A5C3QT93_9AGAR|nr:hypothetical protein BDV98DRAFT_398030 [Pterula gracilis]